MKVKGFVPAQINSVPLSSFQAKSNGCRATFIQSESIQRISSQYSQNAPHERGVASWGIASSSHSGSAAGKNKLSVGDPLKYKARMSIYTELPSSLGSVETEISFTQTASAEQIVTSEPILSANSF